MFVNIKEASKLAGISRTNFYKNYISTGKVSISKDEKDRPTVDTSELLRVFGRLHGEHEEKARDDTKKTGVTPPNTPPDLSAQLAQLEAENAQLRERLEEAKERESWQRGQIEKLTDTIKLLEAPRATTPPPALPTQAERLKGFIDRFLGR